MVDLWFPALSKVPNRSPVPLHAAPWWSLATW